MKHFSIIIYNFHSIQALTLSFIKDLYTITYIIFIYNCTYSYNTCDWFEKFVGVDNNLNKKNERVIDQHNTRGKTVGEMNENKLRQRQMEKGSKTERKGKEGKVEVEEGK